MNLTETQVEEWLSHPVTEQLKAILADRRDWLEGQRSLVYYPGEGQRTNEAICVVQGRLDENVDHGTSLESVEDFLSEVEDIGKHERDLSSGIPEPSAMRTIR